MPVTQTMGSRLHRGALWLLFAAVLLIPKTLALRRRPRVWNVIRLGALLVGTAVGAAGWISHDHGCFWLVAAGTALAILALAIPSERPRLSVDARARELGALVVVEGGCYQTADGRRLETLLFLGPKRLWVMDEGLRPLLEIPVPRITLLRAEPAEDAWKLLFAWDGATAEFSFRGPFAEHFARVAESTVRSQLPNALPQLR